MSEAPRDTRRASWLTRPVALIGSSSLLSDLGHEVPTALLPGFLTATLGAPAAALGVIEGAAGIAKLAGGALADDPHRRRNVAVGGYATTAVLSSAIGLATSPLEVGILRTGAWAARGLRGPSRNALLTDLTDPRAFGRAFGFERMMDNLGAIFGPLRRAGRARRRRPSPARSARSRRRCPAFASGRVPLRSLRSGAPSARSSRPRTPARPDPSRRAPSSSCGRSRR